MKKFLLGALAVAAIFALAGCNAQVIDTTWKFDRAMISLPDGSVVSGKVESWKDYENSDQIQVKIGSTTYWTHAQNVVMIAG